jgi:serine/threonine protein kinase
MKQKNRIGAGHYARSIHFGCGCCEDVEFALDHYDTVTETHPRLFTVNSDRCLRGLNKLPFRTEEIEVGQTVNLRHSTMLHDMADLIVSYKVDPIQLRNGEVLGTGSSGRVTRQKDPRNPENRIAVKHLEGADWSLFVREIAALVRLQHPCIVQIFGWSRVSSNSFEIWMQLAPNGPLTYHLPRGRHVLLGFLRDSTRKARLICDIVIGMRYVHSCGMIHRDLKPDNILLDANGRGLICDFGLSRMQSAEGLPSGDAGTYQYAAPEQWRRGRYNEKVDVFSFGLVVYEIITGRRVFERRRSSRLPDLPQSFGRLMQNVIRRCWSSTPSDRPSFADIFNEFKESQWAVLPGADGERIAASVAEVTRSETGLRH